MTRFLWVVVFQLSWLRDKIYLSGCCPALVTRWWDLSEWLFSSSCDSVIRFIGVVVFLHSDRYSPAWRLVRYSLVFVSGSQTFTHFLCHRCHKICSCNFAHMLPLRPVQYPYRYSIDLMSFNVSVQSVIMFHITWNSSIIHRYHREIVWIVIKRST